MGGIGSTRWNNHRKKKLVEHCISLTTTPMKAALDLGPGASGRLVGYRGNEPVFEMIYIVLDLEGRPALWLHYKVGNEEMDYPVNVVPVPVYWGGIRWRFLCQVTIDGRVCLRRVDKLYLPNGERYFACRHCHDLTYRSSQKAHWRDRLTAQIAKMKRKFELEGDR